MMRRMVGGVAAAALLVTLVVAAPAGATVHEIVGQWCADRGELNPPGITGGSRADNFAQPLNANGFVGAPVLVGGVGLVVQFDFDHPASKVRWDGTYVPIGTIGGVPLFLPGIEPDPGHPAISHCALLR